MRTILRVCCLFLLAIIIMDVTNSKSFNRSLTFRYSKHLGTYKYGEAICNECKKLITCPLKSKLYINAYNIMRPTARILFTWTIFVIKNTCLIMQQIRSYINKGPQTIHEPQNVNPVAVCV